MTAPLPTNRVKALSAPATCPRQNLSVVLDRLAFDEDPTPCRGGLPMRQSGIYRAPLAKSDDFAREETCERD